MTEPWLPEQSGVSGSGMGGRVARGLTWTVVDVWGRQALNLLVFVVLARLLLPVDFGLVALASVFVAFAQLVVDQGLGDALIQRREIRRSEVDTTFWVALATGVLLTVVLVVAAGPIAALVDEPDLEPILRVLALTFVLAAFSSVQIALLRRALEFRSLAVRAIAAAGAGGVVGIAAAAAGAGAWALVAQQVTAAAVSAVSLWLVSPWRPRLHFGASEFRELSAFGLRILGADSLSFVSRYADNLLIGVFLGPVPLGLYAVGYRILTVSQTILVNVARRIAFPALSRLQEDPGRMVRAYMRVTRTASVVIIPGYVGLALVGPELTVTVFGATWSESGLVASVLFLVGPIVAVQAFGDSMLNASGHPGVVLRFRLITAVANVIGFAIAVSFGVVAVAASYVLRAYLLAPLMLFWLRRHAGVDPTTYLRQFRGSATATAVMAASVLAVKLALAHLGPAGLLAVEIPTAVVTFVIALRVIEPGLFDEVREVGAQSLPVRSRARGTRSRDSDGA